jgi:hypothetical protein
MQSHYTIPTSSQYPRQESNLIYDLRKVACGPAHSEDVLVIQQGPEAEGLGPSFAGRKPAVLPLDADD